MIIKLKIQTPQGQAQATINRLKSFLKFLNRAKIETWVNDDDSIIYIQVDGNTRQVAQLMKTVSLFQKLPAMLVSQRLGRKFIKAHPEFHEVTDKDFDAVLEMFENGTSLEILKQATAEEIQEDNLTLWDKIKRTFKKINF